MLAPGNLEIKQAFILPEPETLPTMICIELFGVRNYGTFEEFMSIKYVPVLIGVCTIHENRQNRLAIG